MSNKVMRLIGRILFSCTLILASCSSEKYMENLEKAWMRVCTSENGVQERQAVDAMTRLISEVHGHFTIHWVADNGRKVDLQDLDSQQIPFKTVQTDVYWDNDEHFVGTDWIPRNKGNIDAFFLE